MTIEELIGAVLADARSRLRNGEFTERGLARRVSVSQAHMHHVLKGKRSLTPALADRLAAELRISITAAVAGAGQRERR
jgi:plasmid maintenance system antidote protein VapI